MEEESNGWLLIGGLLVGSVMGWALGSSLGEDDGIDLAIEIIVECEERVLEDESDLLVSECVLEIVDMIRQERYEEAAGDEYP